jgi:hypothetical protein
MNLNLAFLVERTNTQPDDFRIAGLSSPEKKSSELKNYLQTLLRLTWLEACYSGAFTKVTKMKRLYMSSSWQSNSIPIVLTVS